MKFFLKVLFCMFIVMSANAAEKLCDIHFSTGLILHKVPVAVTNEDQANGLSKRMSAGVGMLFAWRVPAQRFFWMHNTWVPLSIGYFDATGRLFLIQEMAPNTDTIHPSVKPALLALELGHGQFEAYKLKVGVKITQFCDVVINEKTR